MNEDVTHVPASTAPTDTVGPYRLLQRIGEGGMGDVWLAEQTRPVHRQVALKVLKAGLDTAQVVARFEAERQALALMSHPAIAQVFDGGATREGRPYFAMEYVRGEPITGYCARHRLGIRQRIDLFLEVCDGVQHAHQKGVIHRDLKPSNILVTERDDHAVPKIIDFGVAKATTLSLTERTLHTEFGSLIGTPEYMSPEQADMSAIDVDTRTDVYALGVVLYELLTGVLPFDSKTLRERPLDEVRRTIREIDPPRPSTRLTLIAKGGETQGGNRTTTTPGELRGDLDWITMRALEKDRARRYGSASDLAADLRRHLDNLPIVASPPSTVYRIQKFVRRHRVGALSAAAAVGLLVAFAATMAVQAQRIARERDRANREAAAAKQVSDFLVGLFKVSDPNEARGNSLTAREILDSGARDVEQRLATQPEVQARLQSVIGDVYTKLGVYSAARPLLERAVATQRRLAGNDNPETLATLHALANAYWWLARYGEAEHLYLEVSSARRRLLGAEHPDTLRVNYDLASAYIGQKRWRDAERLGREVLAVQERMLGEDHGDTLASMNNLAYVGFAQQKYAEVEPLYARVLEIRRRVLGNDHPDTLTSIHNEANTLGRLHRYPEAEALFLEALERKRRVLGETHSLTAWTAARLGELYQETQRYAEAERIDLKAYTDLLHALGPAHAQTETVRQQLVTLYEKSGDSVKAAEWRARQPKSASVTEAGR
jgi:eukaryotic-like serine/threonine-protein kinase